MWEVEVKTCKNVTAAKCVDETASFTLADRRVYVWLYVTGPKAGGTLEIRWYKGNIFIDKVARAIGGSPWVVSARKTLRDEAALGDDWRIEVRDPDGKVIHTATFGVK